MQQKLLLLLKLLLLMLLLLSLLLQLTFEKCNERVKAQTQFEFGFELMGQQ